MERLLEGSSDPEKRPRPCGNCGKERQGQPEESSDPPTLNPGTGPAAEGAGAAPSSPHPGGPRHSGNAGLLARRGSPVTVCTQTWCPCRGAGSPGRGELSITWVWPVPSPPLGLAVFVLKMRTSSCDPRAGPPGWRPLCHASSISRAAPPDPTPETEASEHFLTDMPQS